jgi:protein TonB
MANWRFWQNWPPSLRWALGISLAIHLLIIVPIGLTLYTPVAIPQAPLSAVLKGPGEVTHAARADASRFAPVSAGDSARTSAKQPIKPLPVREEALSRTVPSLAVPAVAGVAQGDVSAQSNAASRLGVVGGAPDSVRDGIEADALNRYRLALGVEARKARRYPEASRTRGQEGTCEIYVVLSRSGGMPLVLAGKSSGSTTLDDGAVAMVRIAAERTPVPQELQGRNLKIPLRIRFSLDDF